MSETEQPVVPVVKWGSQVLVSREMLGLQPYAPVPEPPLRLRAFYFLRRRWWSIKRLPGYRLVHKDDIGCDH